MFKSAIHLIESNFYLMQQLLAYVLEHVEDKNVLPLLEVTNFYSSKPYIGGIRFRGPTMSIGASVFIAGFQQ